MKTVQPMLIAIVTGAMNEWNKSEQKFMASIRGLLDRSFYWWVL